MREVMERVKKGELIPDLARELGYSWPSPLYGLLKRNFGYIPTGVWESNLKIPEKGEELAYMAGIIDGEGSIIKAKDRNNKNGTLCKGRWSIKISMTDEEVIDWLHQFGGQKTIHNPPGKKTVYHWNVARRTDVRGLLEALLPYMVLRSKIERATQAIEESTPSSLDIGH